MKLNLRNESGNSNNKVYLQFEGGELTGKLSDVFGGLFEIHRESERFEKKASSAFNNAWVEGDEINSASVFQAGKGCLKETFKVGKAIVQYAQTQKYESVEIELVNLDGAEDKSEFVRNLGIALSESAYKFDTYKTGEKKEDKLETFVVLPDENDLRVLFEEGLKLGEGTKFAKMLVNEPANIMIPERMAEEAVKAGEAHGFEVKVMEDAEIEALNMPAYLTVAKASENRPRLIVMEYKGNPDNAEEILGLVGKGLSFDTGGYSLKPPTGMATMKTDMGGAAAVIGAMAVIAGQKLKVNVTAVVAACENMISGGCYRPGDIIDSRGGKTIFIKSTDAEGRLTLVDAIDYIIKDLKVSRVVDIATLTGAQVIALGMTVTGAVSNDDDFWAMMESASKTSGEDVWRMPLTEEIVESIKHKEADITNAVREAGMITAGAFIGEFIGETPWIHLDIAGPSWTEKPLGLTTYGATGVGVKNLYYLAKSFE